MGAAAAAGAFEHDQPVLTGERRGRPLGRATDNEKRSEHESDAAERDEPTNPTGEAHASHEAGQSTRRRSTSLPSDASTSPSPYLPSGSACRRALRTTRGERWL